MLKQTAMLLVTGSLALTLSAITAKAEGDYARPFETVLIPTSNSTHKPPTINTNGELSRPILVRM